MGIGRFGAARRDFAHGGPSDLVSLARWASPRLLYDKSTVAGRAVSSSACCSGPSTKTSRRRISSCGRLSQRECTVARLALLPPRSTMNSPTTVQDELDELHRLASDAARRCDALEAALGGAAAAPPPQLAALAAAEAAPRRTSARRARRRALRADRERRRRARRSTRCAPRPTASRTRTARRRRRSSTGRSAASSTSSKPCTTTCSGCTRRARRGGGERARASRSGLSCVSQTD